MTESETQNPEKTANKQKKKHTHNPFRHVGKLLKKPFQSHHKQTNPRASTEQTVPSSQTNTPIEQNDQNNISPVSLADSQTNEPSKYVSTHTVSSETSTSNGDISLEAPNTEISPKTKQHEQDDTKDIGLASNGYSFNQILEKYVPGWRFLMHLLFVPIVSHNIKAGDIWVGSLSGSLSAMLGVNTQHSTDLTPQNSLLVNHRLSQHKDAQLRYAQNDNTTLSDNRMDHTVMLEAALGAKPKPT